MSGLVRCPHFRGSFVHNFNDSVLIKEVSLPIEAQGFHCRISFALSNSPMAGGLVLLPKKLVRNSDWIKVDLPRPASPREMRHGT